MSTPASAGPDLLIRRAGTADAAALARFAEDTFRHTFAADNDPSDMAAYCAASYGAGIQRAEIEDPGVDTLLACDGAGAIAAYAQLRPGAPSAGPAPEPIELWRFYVGADWQGRGLASRLMAAVLDAAAARGARTLWLGVWERNLRAQAFYRKCGFTAIGRHTFVLGRDRQTDVLMARPVAR